MGLLNHVGAHLMSAVDIGCCICLQHLGAKHYSGLALELAAHVLPGLVFSMAGCIIHGTIVQVTVHVVCCWDPCHWKPVLCRSCQTPVCDAFEFIKLLIGDV